MRSFSRTRGHMVRVCVTTMVFRPSPHDFRAKKNKFLPQIFKLEDDGPVRTRAIQRGNEDGRGVSRWPSHLDSRRNMLSKKTDGDKHFFPFSFFFFARVFVVFAIVPRAFDK